MGNMSVLSELGSLIWNHPYVSCSLLIFLTPPFLPILKFFSPLLISTALFVVALVTMGPHFEPPPDAQDDETFLINASEFTKSEDHYAPSEQRELREPTWSDWVHSWKDSWVTWVEKKLQNENWQGGSLNDDNVTILQEAFAHRNGDGQAPLTRSVSAKLVTRRIPDDEAETRQLVDAASALSRSDSWASDRSFDRAATSGASFFSPHPSFSRRCESEMNPLFENVIPPPIEYDMPPLITGPASITAPLFKSLEDDMDLDASDEEDDDQHDHEHLEVGESTVDEHVVPNGTHHQSAEDAVDVSPPVMDGSSLHAREIDGTGAEEGSSGPPAPEEPHVPEAESERCVPATSEIEVESLQSKPEETLQDIPELEDVLPVENEKNPADEGSADTNPPASVPDEVVPATSADEVPAAIPAQATTSADEVPAAIPVQAATSAEATPTPATSQEEALPAPATSDEVHHAPVTSDDVLAAPHVVERSMSLPVHGTHTDTEIAHEDLPPLDENAPHALSHAVSLPATTSHPIILPPKTSDPGPSSPDSELGTVTTAASEEDLHHKASTKDTIEAPAPEPEITAEEEITVEEEITHVTDSKVFRPDAPQLKITPPSTKVVLAPAPVKYSASSGQAGPSRFVSRYSSSDDDSGDEEIDLDSDVEVVGEDEDSDAEVPPLVKLKAPPKPDQMRPAPHALVQA